MGRSFPGKVPAQEQVKDIPKMKNYASYKEKISGLETMIQVAEAEFKIKILKKQCYLVR